MLKSVFRLVQSSCPSLSLPAAHEPHSRTSRLCHHLASPEFSQAKSPSDPLQYHLLLVWIDRQYCERTHPNLHDARTKKQRLDDFKWTRGCQRHRGSSASTRKSDQGERKGWLERGCMATLPLPHVIHSLTISQDLSLPKSMIARLAKGVLPANTQIHKDALLALHKSATVFVSYIASK